MQCVDGILSGYNGLRVAIIPKGRKRRPGYKMNPTTTTIHNTGCDMVKADNFKRGCHDPSQDMQVSYHFVIDESEVIQLLPINEVAWHAGDRTGNYTSIGVEICERPGAEENAIKFVAELLHLLGDTHNELRTHKSWSGKQCPRKILGHWEDFKRKVEVGIKDLSITKKIKIELNGVVKEVTGVNVNGHNYVMIRDIADDHIEVTYDSARNLPVIRMKTHE